MDNATASDYAIVNLVSKGRDADATPDQILDAATRVHESTGCTIALGIMLDF